jgi:hypothetical protein
LGSEIRQKTEGNERAFKIGGDSCRIGSMEGSGRTGQGSRQTIVLVVVVVVAVAAVLEVVVVVLAIIKVTNPCRTAQALWVPGD